MSGRHSTLAALSALLTALAVAGCGGGTQTASPLAISVEEGVDGAGRFQLPNSTAGGLVEISLANRGKSPHSAQLALIKGEHTVGEALKVIQGNGEKTPGWLRAEGGVGTTAPGATGRVTLNLPAGTYAVTELGGPGLVGAPASGSLTVAPGDEGDLPSTPASVTAAATGKDRFAWEISGLKAGENELTFESEGDRALHLVAAYRIKDGQDPSLAEIKESFASPKPPAFAELETVVQTAVLDGGRSQTTTLDLEKGTYVFFCPLSDRDGGKAHFEEGLLKKVEIEQ